MSETRIPSRDDLLDGLIDMTLQFAYRGAKDGVPVLHTGGLSALEGAFDILGWSDPQPYPDGACEVDGCGEWATCGIPTPDGYKRVCGAHFTELEKSR